MLFRRLIISILFVSLLPLSLAGCGSTQSSPPQPSTKTSIAHKSSKRPTHHHAHILRVTGTVSEISSTQLVLKTARDTIWTFLLMSHTKYRAQKTPIKLSQIKVGSKVSVRGVHKKTKNVARVVHLL